MNIDKLGILSPIFENKDELLNVPTFHVIPDFIEKSSPFGETSVFRLLGAILIMDSCSGKLCKNRILD